MNKNKESIQIKVVTYFDELDTKKRNKVINQCKLLNSILEQLGYEVKYFDEDLIGMHFLTVYIDERICTWGSSILCPSCMASVKRRPLPLEWFIDLFDLIMDKDITRRECILLEKMAYLYNLKKSDK